MKVELTLMSRVPIAREKQGKWPPKNSVRKNTGNLEILPKHRIVFVQVVNSLILNNNTVMAIFAANFWIFQNQFRI